MTPKKNTILIVEDEEVNYLFIEILLTDVLNLDCTILHAKNGKEAVEFCKDNPAIEFVLMDIKMPIMNGYDATKLIKEFNPNLTIVAQTAYTTAEDRAKAFEVGCNDFIPKPVDKTVLRPILTKYLNITFS
ncbi:response regulator [Flavobacterium sp.]|uniref:response regulator n=1 Tax=Flavobacterium sp. TaxID=239 RepID=UPI004047AF35